MPANEKLFSPWIIPSAVRGVFGKNISMSRRWTPVQLQTSWRMVTFGVRLGSLRAKVGRMLMAGVSQVILPSSTTLAIIMVVMLLPVEPIIISVSGVMGSGLPFSRTPKPCW